MLSKMRPTLTALLIPSGLTLALGTFLGRPGAAAGSLISLIVTPMLFLMFSSKKRPIWKKTGMASLLTGVSFIAALFSGATGSEMIYKTTQPEAYQNEINYQKKVKEKAEKEAAYYKNKAEKEAAYYKNREQIESQERKQAEVNMSKQIAPKPQVDETEIASIMLSVSCAGNKGLVPRSQMGSTIKEMLQSKGIDPEIVYKNWDYYWGIAKEMDTINKTYCLK